MQTVYDWVTVAFFAGLVVLLLQRSIGPDESRDSLYHYIVPAGGCAVTNYLGNNGYDAFAILTFVGVIAYTIYFLKPFART
ncbi:MAG: hypothetical protein EOP67_32135 [Sphingomonas sp.]|nr:MAG: hypothetical protein EOP67_32135 [Sphingomonas sp.]